MNRRNGLFHHGTVCRVHAYGIGVTEKAQVGAMAAEGLAR